MSAGQQIAMWALAVIVPLLLNLATKRDADAMGLSAMVALTWVFGRLMGALFTPPESMALYPLVDLIAGVTAFTAWRTRKRFWKLALTGVFLLHLCNHAAFWVAWETEHLPRVLYQYVLVNNVLFALELLCVCVPGGSRVWVGWAGLIARLPRSVRGHHLRGTRGG